VPISNVSRGKAYERKYGITEEDFQRMLAEQRGVCAICQRHQLYQRLAVDHDHRSKKVRGLLCVQCNRGLGRFFDSPYRLRRAAEYLEKANGKDNSSKPLQDL